MTEHTYVVPGRVYSKKNSKIITRVGKGSAAKYVALPSTAYRAWEKEVRKIMAGVKPLSGPLAVRAVIYYKGNRPDLSGALESIGDCFEGILWENDGQIESWDGSRLIYDGKNPRISISVKRFEPGTSIMEGK